MAKCSRKIGAPNPDLKNLGLYLASDLQLKAFRLPGRLQIQNSGDNSNVPAAFRLSYLSLIFFAVYWLYLFYFHPFKTLPTDKYFTVSILSGFAD